MKKITAILGVLAAVASLSLADSGPEASAKDTKKMVQNNFVETAQKGIKLSGYVDAGYSYNFAGSGSVLPAGQTSGGVTGAPGTVNSRFGSDTASQGDFNLYAVKLALEKALTSENKAQAGFRTDVMIGEDAQYFNNRDSQGNGGVSNYEQNSSSLFLEQAYVSIRAPVGNGWDFKVGKFVSILGYEVIERPANMNITYGLLFQNAYPLWYTGVLSSYKFDDYLDAKLGVVNGSNTDNNLTTSGSSDAVALLAALNVTAPGGNANWSNNFQYSTASESDSSTDVNSNSYPVGNGAADGTFDNPDNGNNNWTVVYNSWGNWAPKFADDKLLFAFDAVLGNSAGNNSNSPNSNNTTWWGAGLYAKYQFNDWFYLASRGEYFGSDNTGKFSNDPDLAGSNCSVSWWEYTLTAGFNVIDNLLIRAEYRLDWGNYIAGQADGTSTNLKNSTSSGPAHYAGAEVVYSF